MSADDKPRRRKLSEDECALWREVRRSIKPLRKNLVDDELPPAQAPSVAAKPPASPQVLVRPAPARTAAPPLAALDRRSKQRLARGTLAIDDRLDLHGCTEGEAHEALLHFLRRAQSEDARFVLVITGKGVARGTDRSERGVLRRKVPLWLGLPEFRSYVVGFEDAHVAHGGQGALYVRLRRSRP